MMINIILLISLPFTGTFSAPFNIPFFHIALTGSLRNHLLTLAAVAILYAVPVVQLVISSLAEFNKGNQDTCYYNFGCLRPLGSLPPFNNVMSNGGYVMLGLLFIFIVWRRSQVLHDAKRNAMRKKLGQEVIVNEQEGPSPELTRGLPRT